MSEGGATRRQTVAGKIRIRLLIGALIGLALCYVGHEFASPSDEGLKKLQQVRVCMTEREVEAIMGRKGVEPVAPADFWTDTLAGIKIWRFRDIAVFVRFLPEAVEFGGWNQDTAP